MEYIRVPFADSGDKTEVPVEQQSDNSVSFTQGYPLAYSLDPETDPSARRIEREGMNGLFWTLSKAIQEIQQQGVASFIPAADNGGSAFTYALGAVVFYNGQVYRSLKNNNTDAPTVEASWAPLLDTDNTSRDFIPVGVPIPWPTITPPAGWIACIGQNFTAAQWPKLALAYPSLRVPDLRGVFLRGWDNGRALDNGRSIMTTQLDALQNITGSFSGRPALSATAGALVESTGAFVNRPATGNQYIPFTVSGSTSYPADVVSFDASRVAKTATETRPVNVSYNYIVRAK